MKNGLKGSGISNSDIQYIGTMQDRTLDALRDISKSLDLTVQSLTKLSTGFDNMTKSMDSIVHSQKQQRTDLSNMINGLKHDANLSSGGSAASLKKSLDDQIKAQKDAIDRQNKATDDNAKKQRDVIDYVERKVISLFTYLGDVANKWSNTTNSLVQSTGMNANYVRESRHEFADMISTLNTQTGYAYNASEAYQTMANLSQSVTGNLEAIEELSRPMTLASKSIPGDLTNIATTFNRLYTRYNFTSKNMEDALDGILSNTANSAASQEDITQAWSTLNTMIMVSAGGDKEKYLDLYNATGSAVRKYSDAGVDEQALIDLVNTYFHEEDMEEISRLLSLSGTGIDYYTGLSKLTSGNGDDLVSVIDALAQGLAGAADQVTKNGYTAGSGQGLKILTSNGDLALQLQDYFTYGSVNLPEEISASMVDNVESLYVSAEDKIINALSPAGENLATIQEKIGIGFSDVSKLLNIIIGTLAAQKVLGALGGGGGVKGFLGRLLGGSGSTGAAEGASSSLLSRAGTAVGGSLANVGNTSLGYFGASTSSKSLAALAGVGTLAGIAGGIGLGIDGISTAVDESKSAATRAAAGVEGTAGLIGAAGIGVSAAAAAGIGGATLAGIAGIAGPIGWAALGVAGIAKLISIIADQMDMSGAAVESTKKAYEEAAKSLREETRTRETSLLDIKASLATSKDLEEQRDALINSGLITDEDITTLVANWSESADENKKALEDLTDAYLSASRKMSVETAAGIKLYELEDSERVETFNDLFASNNTDLLNSLSSTSQAAFLSQIQTSLEKQQAAGTINDAGKELLDRLKTDFISFFDEDENGDYRLKTDGLYAELWKKGLNKSGAMDADFIASIQDSDIFSDWESSSNSTVSKLMNGDFGKSIADTIGSEAAGDFLSRLSEFDNGGNRTGEEALEFVEGIQAEYGGKFDDKLSDIIDKYGLEDQLQENHLDTDSQEVSESTGIFRKLLGFSSDEYEDTEGKKLNRTQESGWTWLQNQLLPEIKKLNPNSSTTPTSRSGVGLFTSALSSAWNALASLDGNG